MEDELVLYLSQRAELITSDDADLAQLRKQDRRLLSAMDRGALDSPLAQRDGAMRRCWRRWKRTLSRMPCGSKRGIAFGPGSWVGCSTW